MEAAALSITNIAQTPISTDNILTTENIDVTYPGGTVALDSVTLKDTKQH